MSIRSRLAITAMGLALATPVVATTIVPLDDQHLVDRALLVLMATVDSKLPATDEPVTRWMVTVDRVLKGTYNASSLVVRELGGETADGRGLKIFGAPPFAPGVQALLFLQERPDGTFAIRDFPQGAFLGAKTALRTLAFRDFSQVRVLDRPGHQGSLSHLRDLDRFANWIADRADGIQRPADYSVTPSVTELQSIPEAFSLLSASGYNMRWFNFDSGGSVGWYTSPSPLPGLTDGGVGETKRGLAAWTNEPTTPIRLVYMGTSTAKGGFNTSDGRNVVLWNDPNDEIAGVFDCSAGGTLAIGGPWYDVGDRGTFNGKSYIRIQEADIITQAGIECEANHVASFPKFIEELIGHELGHTLGLSHSSEDRHESNFVLKQALMYAYIHVDGRGAQLNSDDIAAIQTLYRKGGAVGGGGGGGGGTGSQKNCPADTLCLQNGRFELTANWKNQFDSTSGVGHPIYNSDISGFFYFTDARNVELITKVLDFDGTIKVFYSELTNLNFTLTVKDTTTGKAKTYSNTTGDCGAIDNDFSTGSSSTALASTAPASAATAACAPSSSRLCLNNARFAVTVDWNNQYNGSSGVGAAKTLSDLTGAFSFDSPANLEILIKTLDFNGQILVIYGSLSNYNYTIHVVDTSTGKSKDYHNTAGNYCGGLDQNAF